LTRNFLQIGVLALALTSSLSAAAQTVRRVRGTIEQLDGIVSRRRASVMLYER